MKKNALISLLLAVTLLAFGGCSAQGTGEQVNILTTFYPMYIFTLNIADGIDGVTVQNMADQNVGCLHDYQLQTRDMVELEEADVLVINGGGMEQFMEKVISMRSDLPVITASEGIEMLPLSGHAHEHDHENEACTDVNAHVWLDPSSRSVRLRTLQRGCVRRILHMRMRTA